RTASSDRVVSGPVLSSMETSRWNHGINILASLMLAGFVTPAIGFAPFGSLTALEVRFDRGWTFGASDVPSPLLARHGAMRARVRPRRGGRETGRSCESRVDAGYAGPPHGAAAGERVRLLLSGAELRRSWTVSGAGRGGPGASRRRRRSRGP